MKLVVYGPDRRVGSLQDTNQVIDLNGAYAKYAREVDDDPLPVQMASAMVPGNLQDYIEAGDRAIEGSKKALEYLTGRAGDHLGLRGETLIFAKDQVKIHAPLPSRAARLAMAGGNFSDHILGMYRRRQPDLTLEQAITEARQNGIWGFWKIAQNVVGPDEDVIHPKRSQRLDYEGEVTMILGKKAYDAKADRVNDYIWGYTLQNDWSLRDQPEAGGYKFVIAKNFDGSSSLGPCIVVDELKDPQDIAFETKVSGQLRQKGNTKDMIFSFGEFLEYLTRDNTFLPGDMIAAGTCAGTAADSSERDESGALKPDRFAHPGDVVEITVDAIGTLRNRVVEAAGAFAAK
jgi:acylpyruvate hydrolase